MIDLISKPVIIGLAATTLAAGAWGGIQTLRLDTAQKQVAAFKQAGALAILRARMEKRVIENEQEQVNAKIEAMRGSLADIGGKYERLRAQGRGRKADLPVVPGSPALAYDTAFDDRLLDTLEQAELNTAKLLGWQAWYREQSQIDRSN